MGIYFSLLERNDGRERNLHATLYDESKKIRGKQTDNGLWKIPLSIN